MGNSVPVTVADFSSDFLTHRESFRTLDDIHARLSGNPAGDIKLQMPVHDCRVFTEVITSLFAPSDCQIEETISCKDGATVVFGAYFYNQARPEPASTELFTSSFDHSAKIARLVIPAAIVAEMRERLELADLSDPIDPAIIKPPASRSGVSGFYMPGERQAPKTAGESLQQRQMQRQRPAWNSSLG